MKDAYRLSNGYVEGPSWEGWRLIWKMKVQECVRVVIWIMSHGKLLTNLERWKHRMATSPTYGRCNQDEETLHAIRDC